MKKLAFLVLLTLQLVHNAGIEDAFYKHNNIRCEKCERGQKVKVHCTIDWHKSECVACEEGTFADRYSSSKFCEQCTDCSHTDQIIKKNCTPEKNTECKCPDKKYHSLGFCRACNPPKIKRVRDEREYCEDCEYGSYFNNTVEDCVKCDICTGDQVTWRVCNVTHNTQCKQLPTATTENNEDTLSGGEIAGIVSGVIGVIIVVIIIIIIVCKKKEDRFKEDSFKVEYKNNISSGSKPEWMNEICQILIDNLSPFDVFVYYLGTPEFIATVKWGQLSDLELETRLYKFMKMWYEHTNQPSLNQIISALKEIKRNDIVNMIQNDVKLKEQLSKENKINENRGVSSNAEVTEETKLFAENKTIIQQPEASYETSSS